jgi:hypothetical protein
MDFGIGVLLFLATGLISGIFGSILGLGGATIMIPILTLIFNIPIQLAIAISLISNFFVSGTAVLSYSQKGLLHKNIVMVMNIGSIAGIIAGTYIAANSPSNILKIFFGIFMLLMVIIALLRKKYPESGPVKEPKDINKAGFSALGFIMGLLGGTLGIGGGGVSVPIQTQFLKIPLKNAIANSLGTILVSAFIGAILYFYLGAGKIFSIDEALITTATIVPGSIAGARLGTSISDRLPSEYIKYIFYTVLIFIAYNMIKSGMGW